MARRLHYKAHVIQSKPEPVAASGRWKFRIAIYWKVRGILKMQQFLGLTLHNNEDEADLQGIAHGQRIIDEKPRRLKAG